jgi:TonB family protein
MNGNVVVPPNKRMLTSTKIVLLLAAALQGTADNVADPIEAVTASSKTVVVAKAIDKMPPIYPQAALFRGKEAWVHVTYCIDESGETQNVSILDSVGGPEFERAAIDAVDEWEFEPALMDGNPSWQSHNDVYMNFAISNNPKGASSSFIKQFKKLGKLIDEKKLDEADELFWHVHDTYDLSLYELSKLWAQRVRFEILAGDMQKVDLALHRATASDGKWIERKSYINLLMIRVQVEVIIGQYQAAIEAFEELTDVAGEKSKEAKAARPIIEKLTEMIGSDQILRIEAKVITNDQCTNCNSSWDFSPVRRVFALNNISGELTSIEIRCDHKRFESKVSDNVQWNIPDHYGSCRVTIFGDPGTTFDVLMPPSAAIAQ